MSLKNYLYDSGNPYINIVTIKLSYILANPTLVISYLIFLSLEMYSMTSPPSFNFCFHKFNWRSTNSTSSYESNKYSRIFLANHASPQISMWTKISWEKFLWISYNECSSLNSHLANCATWMGFMSWELCIPFLNSLLIKVLWMRQF